MGISTHAVLGNGTKLDDLVTHINNKYGETEVRSSKIDNTMYNISFNDGPDKRQLTAFFDDMGYRDYGLKGVLVSLSTWGNSVPIMKYILDEFGGYLSESDFDGTEFYMYNQDGYDKNSEFTEVDKVELKIMTHFGYETGQEVIEYLKNDIERSTHFLQVLGEDT